MVDGIGRDTLIKMSAALAEPGAQPHRLCKQAFDSGVRVRQGEGDAAGHAGQTRSLGGLAFEAARRMSFSGMEAPTRKVKFERQCSSALAGGTERTTTTKQWHQGHLLYKCTVVLYDAFMDEFAVRIGTTDDLIS